MSEAKERPSEVLRSSLMLKIVAFTTMFIDHLAAVLYDTAEIFPLYGADGSISKVYLLMRIIGRTAFPIFCFTLVEGVKYTKNRVRYALRLLIFALISELPFDIALFGSAIHLEHQNVIVTLLLGMLALCFLRWVRDSWQKTGLRILGYFLYGGIVLGLGFVAKLLRTDYDFGGLVVIGIMGLQLLPLDKIRPGLAEHWAVRGVLATAAMITLTLILHKDGYMDLEQYGLAAVPFICLYNGKIGPKNKALKWVGYAFYPGHLAILALIFVIVPVLIKAFSMLMK